MHARSQLSESVTQLFLSKWHPLCWMTALPNLYSDINDVRHFGLSDMKILCDHFGEAQQAIHPKTNRNNQCDPKLLKQDVMALVVSNN